MAKLGILGGMGPQATQIFYQWILDRTPASRDQDHIPTVIYSDTQIPDRTEAILSGKEEAVRDRLREDCQLLESCGCSAIAIPCNTSHYFVDQIQDDLSVPILHMPRETVRRLQAAGKKKIGILATDGTLVTGVYRKEIEAAGMEAFAPDEKTQALVMSLIYDQIKAGEKGNRKTFAQIDHAVRQAGCDAAILGCTELSVYREYHGLSSFYVDAMEVLVETCIRHFGMEPLLL